MIPLLLGVAGAATLTVDPEDAGAFATISAAIAAASDGDTLTVAPGTYAECVNTGGRDLVLVGSGADETVLDGSACSAALTLGAGESVTVRDLSITAPDTRAIVVWYSALTLEGVRVVASGNNAAVGGGLYAQGSALELSDCSFDENLATYGGAIYLEWYNTLRDQGSTFTGNDATVSGGAIYSYGYDVLELDGTVFRSNGAGESAGALAMIWGSGLSAREATFEDNHAWQNGGAAQLYCVDSEVVFEDTTFEDNTANGNGGALELEWYSALTLSGGRFHGNAASGYGGALFGYALDALTVERASFCANRAAVGGALAQQWTAADTLNNNIFADNRAESGGALYRYGAAAGVVRNNTFVGNTASAWGGAYLGAWQAYGDLRNNIVAWSTDGAGVYASDAYDYAYTTLAWNGWHANAPVDAGGYLYIDVGIDGNVAGDPMFVAYSPGDGCDSYDLRLQAGSPYRGAGDPEILDPDGGVSDLGAYGGPEAEDDGIADADPDSGEAETGEAETGQVETGSAETGTPDTGTPEGADSGSEAESGEGNKSAGCGCASGGQLGSSGALSLLGLLLARRRRRAA